MSSPYKVLVNNDDDVKCDERVADENENTTEVIKTGFSIETEIKKAKWMTPGTRSKIRKYRKCAIIFTCLGFIAFFALINIFLAHHIEQKCVPPSQKTDWNLTISGFEISTNLELTSYYGTSKDIIFGYHSTHKTNDTGLMMLNGSSGSIVWKQSLSSTPKQIDCQSLDINKDGINDCFVVGDSNMIAAINAVNGKLYWYIHTHGSKQKPSSYSMPLVVPFDFNLDYVKELISILTMADGQRHLAFISGMTGRTIGQYLPFPTWCKKIGSEMKVVNVDRKGYLVIGCITNFTGEVWIGDIEELNRTVRKPSSTDIHSPLFRNIYKCNKQATELSLFIGTNGQVITACNNGEMAAIDIRDNSVIWKSIVPFFTHDKVMGATPPTMNNELITSWTLDQQSSTVIALNLKTGKINWQQSVQGIVSVLRPYHLRKKSGKYNILLTSKSWHKRNAIGNNLKICHLTDNYFNFNPKNKNMEPLSLVNHFFSGASPCNQRKATSSATTGNILGKDYKQYVMMKRLYSSSYKHNYHFNVTFSMHNLKSNYCS